MQYRNRQMPYENPLANALVIVVGAIAIGISLVVGFVALAALFAAVVILMAIVGIRGWWQQYRGRSPNTASRTSNATARPEQPAIIEGEYQEVKRPGAEQRPPQT